MLTLINTNRMTPPIAPIGLDYVATAARAAGVETAVLDLALADDAAAALREHFAGAKPDLVGLTFRNVDDCFWPSGKSFLPGLCETVAAVRRHTDAPIVLGGVGYSIFAERILDETGADFGIRGDGERAIVELHRALAGHGRLDDVPGLIRRGGMATPSFAWPCSSSAGAPGPVANMPPDGFIANAPAWGRPLSVPTARDAIDNAAYFRLGGQGGVETKRGCPRQCAYCADPLAKGALVRPRPPAEVAEEVATLADRGVDVLHLCDGEFNVPRGHALAVCEALTRRGPGGRVRWYTYMAVTPFDAELASAMRRAGCVGIDFTTDSASPAMLATYGHAHGRQDIAAAARLCREHGIASMFDLLLGGPGETEETVAGTIAFMKALDVDAVGAALGLRIYPGTPAEGIIRAEGPMETNPSIRRRGHGPVDLLGPTFYISAGLGERPAGMVRERIAGDERFFEPSEAIDSPRADPAADYNYNDNAPLVAAIADGARGAYWHILRQLRGA